MWPKDLKKYFKMQKKGNQEVLYRIFENEHSIGVIVT